MDAGLALDIKDGISSVWRLAAAGEIESVSRYVTEAVAFHRAHEDGLAVFERRFDKPPADALECARNLVVRRLDQRDRSA